MPTGRSTPSGFTPLWPFDHPHTILESVFFRPLRVLYNILLSGLGILRTNIMSFVLFRTARNEWKKSRYYVQVTIGMNYMDNGRRRESTNGTITTRPRHLYKVLW